jgi:hypothetical protein
MRKAIFIILIMLWSALAISVMNNEKGTQDRVKPTQIQSPGKSKNPVTLRSLLLKLRT